MQEFLSQYYIWIVAAHLIGVISWMAGMLYLPRLFVYHVSAEKGSDQSETFKIMERKLLRIIINPAMIAVWVFGLLMLYASPGLLEQHWMHVKLTAVVLMTGVQHGYIKWVKRFAADENVKSEKFFRIINEIPTVLMIIIVIMVIVQPF